MQKTRDAPPTAATTDMLDAFRALSPQSRAFTHHERDAHADSLLERFSDDEGYTYWFDPRHGAIARAEAPARDHQTSHAPRPENRLPVILLRDRAVALIDRQRAGFRDALSTFHPYEGNEKRNVYRFRWEDCGTPLAESAAPPYIEVTLRADGLLLEYVNCLAPRDA